MERVPVKDASVMLGLHPDTLRIMMTTGELPIGRVVKGKRRNTYLIYKNLLEKELGREAER